MMSGGFSLMSLQTHEVPFSPPNGPAGDKDSATCRGDDEGREAIVTSLVGASAAPAGAGAEPAQHTPVDEATVSIRRLGSTMRPHILPQTARSANPGSGTRPAPKVQVRVTRSAWNSSFVTLLTGDPA